MTSVNIVQNSTSTFPGLNITYNGESLETITTSKIAVRNYGNDAVIKQDIAPNDPIRVSVLGDDKDRIFDYSVIYISNKANKIAIQRINDSCIEIIFDFFDAKDYAIIQILHSGRESLSLQITGTIIGAKKPFVDSNLMLPEVIIKKPFFKFFTSMMRFPRFAASSMFMILAILSGLLIYLFVPNLITSVVCLIPVLYFLYTGIRIVFMPARPETEALMTDFLQSTMDTVIEQTRRPTSETNKKP